VFVYDGHPGGAGIALRGFELFESWVQRTADLLRDCPCEAGCPSCVQSPKCGNLNEPLHKAGARVLLERMLAAAGNDEPSRDTTIAASRASTRRSERDASLLKA
jgi:DEAD/DEAH box helicase domain-containing protein